MAGALRGVFPALWIPAYAGMTGRTLGMAVTDMDRYGLGIICQIV